MIVQRRIPRFKPYSDNDLVYSMYQGLNQAYEIISGVKPDLLVIPWRGAEPLLRGVQAFASVDGASNKLPPFVALEIGEYEFLNIEGRPVPDFIAANRETIRRKTGSALNRIGKNDPEVMVLDETENCVQFARNFR